MKKRALEVAKNAAILLSVCVAYYIFYSITNIGLKCPLFEVTGLLCPGCGLSRMCISLLHFDLAGALYYNAAALLSLPFLTIVCISYYYEYIRYGSKVLKKWQKILLFICIAALIAFGIFRNIYSLGISPSFDDSLITKLIGGT